jgi:hypothetical protein
MMGSPDRICLPESPCQSKSIDANGQETARASLGACISSNRPRLAVSACKALDLAGYLKHEVVILRWLTSSPRLRAHSVELLLKHLASIPAFAYDADKIARTKCSILSTPIDRRRRDDVTVDHLCQSCQEMKGRQACP